MRGSLWTAVAFILGCLSVSRGQDALPNTAPLTMQGDLSAQMIAGIARFLDRETLAAAQDRPRRWKADSAGERLAEDESVSRARDHLAQMVGAIDARVANSDVEYVSSVTVPAKVAETDRFSAFAVRWPVCEGL